MKIGAVFRWLLGKLPAVTYVVASVWALFFPLFRGHIAIFLIGLFTITVAGAISSFLYDLRLKRLSGVERLDGFGETLLWAPVISPGSSLIECVSTRAGIPPSAIEDLRLQTCELGHHYLGRFRHLMTEKGANPQYMEIVGVGNDAEIRAVKALFPMSKIYRAKKRLTSHFSVIRGGGKTLIWYEPKHEVRESFNYEPQDGAFLVEVDAGKEQEAIARFDRDKATVAVD